MAGSWVNVMGPGGAVRRDWVPAEQPASPDGSMGKWHVVSAPDADSRWEWHPTPAPRPTYVRPPRPSTPLAVPQDLTSNLRRGCMAAVVFGGLMPWATVGPFSITGFSINDGKVLMAIGLAALVLSFAPRFLVVRLLDLVLGACALFASIVNIGNTSQLGAKLGPLFHVRVGSGLIVCAIGSGLWLASLVWEQARLIAARRRTRYTPPAWYRPAH